MHQHARANTRRLEPPLSLSTQVGCFNHRVGYFVFMGLTLTATTAIAHTDSLVSSGKTQKILKRVPRKAEDKASSRHGAEQRHPATASTTHVVSAEDLAQRDKSYSLKGQNYRSPSQADTLLQDAGGIRSALDRLGIGIIQYNLSDFAQNILQTPTKTPQAYAPNTNRGAVGAGNQVYFGERPSYVNVSLLYVSYDASRLGIPDAQIVLGASKFNASWQPFLPNQFSINQLTYYQSAFDHKFEIEAGVLSDTANFVGTNIGASFATTFGPAAAIHALLGMSFVRTPAVVVKYNATEQFYDEASVQRSAPVHGPTGNPLYDEVQQNPAGLRFTAPGDGVFVVDELGYRAEAAPGEPETWIRAAGMYNNSRFQDFSKLTTDPAETKKGNAGLYALADRQILQSAPGSPTNAYRGIYIGGTFEYAPPQTTPTSQYEEARVYSLGPFGSRPTDLASFVYTHQLFSHYIPDLLNPLSQAAAQFGVAVPTAYHTSNTYTVSYLAHLRPGLYASAGLGYTDHPSATSFKGEGHSLAVLAGLLTVF